MNPSLRQGWMATEQDRQIVATIELEERRLRNFIRRRLPNQDDVEDVLQDVFYELVAAYRLLKPIEQVTAWLFRVARNRITDRLRRQTAVELPEGRPDPEDGDLLTLDDLLPSSDAGPEAAYARTVLLEELDNALDELPEEQRSVFVAHEFEGRSFKELAEETGLSVNTLLSRKHYAVRHLRQRLRVIYQELAHVTRRRT